MEILIVAKTKWGEYYCVSGVEILTKKYVRLMQMNGMYQAANTPLKVGDIWDIIYMSHPAKAPHIEDVKVNGQTFVRKLPNVGEFILGNFTVWKNDASNLFDSKLKWENGSGFINDPNNCPGNSVGFWQSDKDLEMQGKYYMYKKIFFADRRIPYKGAGVAIPVIPAGTLIRVSLAKWWKKDDVTENRCYLQLSGWY